MGTKLLRRYRLEFITFRSFFLVIAIVSGALKIVGAVCACVMSGEILKERAKEADRCVMLKMENDVE